MKKIALLTLAALSVLGTSAQAASVDDTFSVSLEIRESCTLSVAAADVDFGQSDRSAAANLDTSSTLSVTCTIGTPWTLGLNNGLNASAGAVSATNRRMTDGTNFIGYGLYRDTARTQLFGDTVGTNTAAGTGNGSAQTVSVFGRVQPGQTNVAAGVYQDTVRAEVIY